MPSMVLPLVGLGSGAVLAAISSGTCTVQAADDVCSDTDGGTPKEQRSSCSQEGFPDTSCGAGAAVAPVLLSCTFPSLHWLWGRTVPALQPLPGCVATEPWDGSSQTTQGSSFQIFEVSGRGFILCCCWEVPLAPAAAQFLQLVPRGKRSLSVLPIPCEFVSSLVFSHRIHSLSVSVSPALPPEFPLTKWSLELCREHTGVLRVWTPTDFIFSFLSLMIFLCFHATN